MRLVASLALFGALALSSPPARAYTLHTTDEGKPVRWAATSVEVTVDEASLGALGDDAALAVSAAFAVWLEVEGAATPEITVVIGPVDEVGYRVGAPNRSTIRFVAGGHAPAGLALATTVVSFDQSGTILDADIVINGLPGRRFAMLEGTPSDHDHDTYGAFDLQDVLAHEAGHFFGLAHNDADAAATMFPDIAPGETSKRSLDDDDEAGLRALYVPVDPPVAGCAFTPRPSTQIAPALLLAAAFALGRRARARR